MSDNTGGSAKPTTPKTAGQSTCVTVSGERHVFGFFSLVMLRRESPYRKKAITSDRDSRHRQSQLNPYAVTGPEQNIANEAHEMSEPPDLKQISVFAPRFFSLLGVVAASFPLLERLTGFLSKPLRYPNVAATLASIAAFALIGSAFLKRRPVGTKEIMATGNRLPTGRYMLLTGAVLVLGYVAYVDFLRQKGPDTTSLEQTALLVWYLACFLLLTAGFWRMGFRAYAVQKNNEQLHGG